MRWDCPLLPAIKRGWVQCAVDGVLVRGPRPASDPGIVPGRDLAAKRVPLTLLPLSRSSKHHRRYIRPTPSAPREKAEYAGLSLKSTLQAYLLYRTASRRGYCLIWNTGMSISASSSDVRRQPTAEDKDRLKSRVCQAAVIVCYKQALFTQS